MAEITMNDLRNYSKLRAAIKSLQQEIQSMYYNVHSPVQHDGGFVSVRTPADPTRKNTLQIIERKDRLEKQLAVYEDLEQRILNFTCSVPDPIIGCAIRWHFIEGLNWSQTCMKVYGYPDKDIVRIAVSRYMKKLEEGQTGQPRGSEPHTEG